MSEVFVIDGDYHIDDLIGIDLKKITSLIFIRFYEELLEGGEAKSPAEALRQAQLWMLNASRREIRLAKREYMGMESSEETQAPDTVEDLRSNPANWAAFYVVGNGFAIFE